MGDEHSFGRRTLLRTAAGTGAAAVVGTVAGSGGRDQGGDDAPRTLVVPDVDFFERGVVGQYVLVTDPEGTAPDPAALPHCPFVDWPTAATRRHQGLLLDRLTDTPHATRVPVYANADRADVTVGTPYVVETAEECGAFLGLGVEAVETTDGTRTTDDRVDPRD